MLLYRKGEKRLIDNISVTKKKDNGNKPPNSASKRKNTHTKVEPT